MLTEASLNAYLGLHISRICPVGYDSDSDNHCAHFVSHVLGYRFGVTCRSMANGQGTPGSIRVQELFRQCLQVGPWADMPSPLFTGLVFITNAGNVHLTSKTIDNVPRKHMGIFWGGMRQIWHYSNRLHKVVRQTPAEFSRHFPAPDNAMFWGSAP